jgi:hypothetical protein
LIAFWLCLVASLSSAETEIPFDEQCRLAREIVVATLTDVEQRACVWMDTVKTDQGLHIRDHVFHRGTLVVEKIVKGSSVTIDATWGTVEPRGHVPEGPQGQEFEAGQRGIWLIRDWVVECDKLPQVWFASLDRLEEVYQAFEAKDSLIIGAHVTEGEELSKEIVSLNPKMHFATLGPVKDHVGYRVTLVSVERSHGIVVDRIEFERADQRAVTKRLMIWNLELSRRANWPLTRYLSAHWLDRDRFQVEVDSGHLGVRIDGDTLHVRYERGDAVPKGARECAEEFLENWKPAAARGEFNLDGKEHLANGAELRGSYMECRLWEPDLEEYVESDELDPTEFGYAFSYAFPIYSEDVFLGVLRVTRKTSPDGTRVVYRASGLSDLQPQAEKRARVREAIESSAGVRLAGFVSFRAGQHREYAVIDTENRRYFLLLDSVWDPVTDTLDVGYLRMNAISLGGMRIVKAEVEAALQGARDRR